MFFRSSRGRVSDWRRGTGANKELEKAAREGSLDIDLGQVLYFILYCINPQHDNNKP